MVSRELESGTTLTFCVSYNPSSADGRCFTVYGPRTEKYASLSAVEAGFDLWVVRRPDQ